jgi:hypothetical protein
MGSGLVLTHEPLISPLQRISRCPIRRPRGQEQSGIVERLQSILPIKFILGLGSLAVPIPSSLFYDA